MNGGTIFVRVVNQDRGRGYMLLIGYDSGVVQRTAIQYMTISNFTRANLDDAIARAKMSYRATEVKDVTASGLVKKFRKMFGEAEPIKE